MESDGALLSVFFSLCLFLFFDSSFLLSLAIGARPFRTVEMMTEEGEVGTMELCLL